MSGNLKRSRKLMADILENHPHLKDEPYSVKHFFLDMVKSDGKSLERFPVSFVLGEWVRGGLGNKPRRIKYLLKLAEALGEYSLSDPFIRKTVEILLPRKIIPGEIETEYIEFVAGYLKKNPDAFNRFPQDVRTDMVLDVCRIGHPIYYEDPKSRDYWNKAVKSYEEIVPELSFDGTAEEVVKNSFEVMKNHLPNSNLSCRLATRVQALVAYHSGKAGYRIVDIPSQHLVGEGGHVAGEFVLPDGRIRFADASWRNEDPREYSKADPETFGSFENQIFGVGLHLNGLREMLRLSGPQYLRRLESSKYY